MSRYGSVTLGAPADLVSVSVESAEPSDLERLTNQAIDNLPVGYRIVDITLAGAGNGSMFSVTIEAGLVANVEGGLSLAPRVKCVLASTAEDLSTLGQATGPSAGTLVDVQVAGATQGRLRMLMFVTGTILPSAGSTGPTGPTAAGFTGPTGPTGASSGGGSQPGYDAVVEHITLTAGGAWLEVPRNGAGTPIRVTLTSLTPGRMLEVFWSFNAIANNPPADIFVYAVVAFGNLAPTFPGDYDVVGNSGGSQTITATSAQRGSCSAFAAVSIPDGMTIAVVELIYKIGFSSVDVYGVDDMFAVEVGTGVSLKVLEVEGAQAGPGNIATPIP